MERVENDGADYIFGLVGGPAFDALTDESGYDEDGCRTRGLRLRP
jgi:hypothetical protein